jgi:hypothetical protein
MRTRPLTPPPALHDRALEDLSFIRRTMEGAAAFTDVPGWGLVGVGALACVAAPLAARRPSVEGWLAVWIGTAAVAALLGGTAMWRKMQRRLGRDVTPALSPPARKFLLGFWPAIVAGALLTLALVNPAAPGVDPLVARRLLPGVWLLLYGLGVTTAGAYSIRAVPLLGAAFIALAAVALLVPGLDGNLLLLLGFGVLHAGFGLFIARRHGG